MNIIEQLKGYQ